MTDGPLRLDLNADVGEGGPDDLLIPFVSSVNVACGGHAGDAESIRRAVALAATSGAAIGAHPSLPDREGFGRRDHSVTPDEAYALTVAQSRRVEEAARAVSRPLAHVKPHGALYNRAARDGAIAAAIAAAVRHLGSGVVLFGLPGSQLEGAASEAGVPFAAEVFADRTYASDGSLTPRNRPDAFVADPVEASRRVLRMLREGSLLSTTGQEVPIRADTVCVHGDGPAAIAFVQALRSAFRAEGIAILPPEPPRGGLP